MSKLLPEIDSVLAEWIREQHMFMVSTAPLSGEGHLNTSPKGGDSLRILGPMEVAYLDYTGSGAETAAHVRENGRILITFFAFTGAPRIVRLHGVGEIIEVGEPEFEAISGLFPSTPGARAVVKIHVKRVSTSCGFGVPVMEFKSDRDALQKWSVSKGDDGLREYRAEKNSISIDGLPALRG